MKLTVIYLIAFCFAIILFSNSNGVEAKKKKHGKGGDRYEIKGKDYTSTENKENRKIRESGNEYTKEEKYNKKENNKNNIKNEKESNSKYNKQKENVDKKGTKYEHKNKGQTEKEIKKEYVNKKTQKYSKKVKENKYNENEPLNGQSYDKNDEKQTLIIEEPKIANDKNEQNVLKKNSNENFDQDVEVIEDIIQNDEVVDENKVKEITKENGIEKNNKKINEEKLLQCNKKTDSVERNITEICEKYKSEKNTQVFEEKIISDKKEEMASKIVDAKQPPKCEL